MARSIADAVMIGKGFMRDSALAQCWADELGVDVHLANQIGWAFGQKADDGVFEH